MITLYSFGPGFGLPDPSPFVTKAEVLLKMAELPYRTDTTGFKKAPKGKLMLHGQGFGRHSPDEIIALGARSIDATAAFLGAKPFMMGSEPTGLDATAFSFVAGALCPLFATPLRTAAERHENLKRYVGRMTARFYPDQAEIAGCKAAA